MKNNLRRVLALLLALMMVVSAFAMTACADETPDNNGDDPAGTPDDGDEKEPEEERLPIDYLPEKKYDGVTINILEWTVNDNLPGDAENWVPWEEIDVDARDGDIIGEAIYDRNGQVEEKYGVTITKEYASINGSPSYDACIKNNHNGGEDLYQMVTLRTTNIYNYCMEGYMSNLFEMENLHTEMPWWSQDSVRSYTMGDALFFAAPEMLLRDKGATALMFYNHTVAANAQIDDLYQVAGDGDWTLEYMIELGEEVAADMDGDDKISSAEDMYGLHGGNRDIPYYLYAGAGMKFAVINDDGYLEMTFDDDSILLWQEIFDDVMYSEYYYTYNVDKELIPENFSVFESDKALFSMGMVKSVVGLRDMESTYGVLPCPKYEEDQENYSSLVWMHHDSVLGIPASVTDVEATTVVLEYMSYLSYYEVYSDFYDTIILGRSARDEQSKEMLEVVFSTRVFDPGQYWLSAQIHSGPGFLTIYESNKTNIASLWAGLESIAETTIEEFNQKVDEIGS